MKTKTLSIVHSAFGPNVKYRSWHKGVRVEEDMTVFGKLRLIFTLLCGWRLNDYNNDCAVFVK